MTAWTVCSETGTLRDVLLCTPDHYDWYPLNAIARASLATGDRPNIQAIRREYREFEDALAEADVVRHYLTPEPHLGYQVYTRDSSQMTPWGPMLTQMFMPMRRGEYAAALAFYQGLGAPFWRYATSGTIEGGDIAIIRPGLLAIGYTGTRTNREGASQCAAWFADQGWDCCLVPLDEHFLHLDVVFSMVADGLAVVMRDALDERFLAWLGRHRIRLIEASYSEAMELSCNVLALGRDRVLSAGHSTRLNAALRAEGLTVLDPDIRLLTRGGGGAHCMTMPLRRDPIS